MRTTYRKVTTVAQSFLEVLFEGVREGQGVDLILHIREVQAEVFIQLKQRMIDIMIIV